VAKEGGEGQTYGCQFLLALHLPDMKKLSSIMTSQKHIEQLGFVPRAKLLDWFVIFCSVQVLYHHKLWFHQHYSLVFWYE